MTSMISPPSGTGAVLGSREPRICHVPEYVSSAGDEAIELAAMAGLFLDGAQQFVLRRALGERPDGTWAAPTVAVVCPRQNGKNAITAARELAGLFLLGEKVVVHSAHEQATASEQFRLLQGLMESVPEFDRRVLKVVNGKGSEAIELRGGQRILFKTRTSGGARGFSIDCIVFDEAYELPEAAISALIPTLSARPNTQRWYTSSAVDQQKHANGTALARQRERGIARRPGIAYFEWSAEGEDPGQVPPSVLSDPAVWAQANPTLGDRISFEAVQGECDGEMGAREFAVERLGVGDWPATDGSADQVIDSETWAALTHVDSAPVGTVCFAFDVTPDRSASSIAVAGRRSDGLAHVEVIEHRAGTQWVTARLAALVNKHGSGGVICDARGPAGSLMAELKAAGVQMKPLTANEHAQACGVLFDAVDQGGLRHLGTAELTAAIKGAVKRPLGDAWAWSRKSSSVDISPLVACTLALWGVAVVDVSQNVW